MIFWAEWPDNNMGLPSNWYDLDIHYILAGVDGVIKQQAVFERSKGYGGYSPQLVALPGAIGLSWVRVDQTTYTRHLARIECAQ